MIEPTTTTAASGQMAPSRSGVELRSDMNVSIANDSFPKYRSRETARTTPPKSSSTGLGERGGDGRARSAAPARMGHVPATVIVGAQWGDEGKGKIVDLLAQDSDLVAATRAARTPGTRSWSEARPTRSGRFRRGSSPARATAIGAGCVVDPRGRDRGARRARRRGATSPRGLVFLSGNAHLDHALARGARRRAGAQARQPADRHDPPWHRSRLRRQGNTHRDRVQDLLDPKILHQKIDLAVRGEERVARAGVRDRAVRRRGGAQTYEGYAQRLRRTLPTPRCSSTVRCGTATACSSRARRGRCSISTTGRIRSSRRRARSPQARPSSFGIGPNRIDEILGVSKAYVTRVGEGAVPVRDRGRGAGARCASSAVSSAP